jgi:PAS domain S-box-containing protein
MTPRESSHQTSGRRPEEWLASVTDAVPALISYIDASQRYRFMNLTYERWFGRPRDGVIGKPVREIVGQEIYDKIRGGVERALAGESVSLEIRVSLPLLGERELEVTFTPDIAPDGTVHGSVDLVTDITERRRLESAQEQIRLRLEAHAERLDLLATVSRAFAESESNLPVLLRTVAEQIAMRFGDTCAIALRGLSDRGDFARSAGAGAASPGTALVGKVDQRSLLIFHDRDREADRLLREIVGAAARKVDHDLVSALLKRTGRAELTADTMRDALPLFAPEPFGSWLERFPVRSVLTAPLRVGARAIGVVVCTRRASGRPYTDYDEALLKEVADRAAIAIDNARLVAELNDANAETDVLYELTDAVNRAESLEGVYVPALEAIVRQVRTDRCAFLLFDSDGVIRFKAWRGLSDEYRRAVEGHSPWRPDQQGVAALVVADVNTDPELASYRAAFDAERIRALAFIPVLHGGRLLGKFMLYSDQPWAFSPAEIKLAQTIADQVASAVGQKQAQAERERLIQQLTHTVRLNELLAGILSHDLRNPLGAILMSATVLVRRMSDPNLVRTAERILTAGTRMNRMIAQLLDFTRVRAVGALPLERAQADVSALFRQAIDELPGTPAGPAVRLVHEGDMRGWWDPDRLVQVGSNLVGNAVRHGAAGGEVSVQIDGRDPATVNITVANAGTIPAELLPIICEPFQRGEMRERRGGLGLGLFITREIVTAHDGTLTVQSSSDITTFTVLLPRGAAA